MPLSLEKIFIPSAGVNIVFNLNSLTPHSRSSIIYDIDHEKQTIIIAQPLYPITPHTAYDEMHLTAVVREEKGKTRVGIKCDIQKFIKNYPLANKSRVNAIALKYTEPLIETNIRSAYRLPLSKHYSMKGKILYNNTEHLTKKDFIFYDVSLTGAGILVPKKKDAKTNPLSLIETHEKIKIGMILLKEDEEAPARKIKMDTIPAIAQIARINANYSDSQVLVGLQFTKIDAEKQDILHKFIHEAQIDELKRLSGL